jgi:uroporphyrinogen-III synthase/uroporphyrinogen III methyltransferase/synthase
MTRAERDGAELRRRLEEEGARVVHVPSVSFVGESDAEAVLATLSELGETAWIVFASRNGARFFADLLRERGVDLPARIRLAAVGPGTAEEVAALFRPVSLVPHVSNAEGLAEALLREARPEDGGILLPAAAEGRRVLETALEQAGFRVRRLTVYRTRVAEAEDGALRLPPHVDFVLFTSPTTVRGFLARSAMPEGAEAVSIGPATTRAVRAAGLTVREARQHDLEGLIEVLG